jgi:hypothetical protein
MKVVYSRAAFQPGYPDLVANIPVLGMAAERGCLIDGSDGAAIVAQVAPRDGDVILAHLAIESTACSTVSGTVHTASLESVAMLAEIVTSDDLISLAA